VLDCRVPWQGPTTDDQADQIRKTLVNLAVDEALACAIYDEITAAAGLRLEHLRLETETRHLLNKDYYEMQEWAAWIGRSWVLDRNDMRAEVAVREAKGRMDRDYLRGRLRRVEVEGRDVWTELWPARGEDWRDDWHSFLSWGIKVEHGCRLRVGQPDMDTKQGTGNTA